MVNRTALGLLTALAAIIQVGCGQIVASDVVLFDDLHPVSGQILFRGEPIPDASIRLTPVAPQSAGAGPVISGVVDAEGNFEIFTFRAEGKGQGVAAGEYQLSVTWRGPLQGLTKEQEDELNERLPAKYIRPQTSGIQITVIPGQNQLDPITLK